MRGIDLERFAFDTDLTLAILWMNADGTIYHRYGSRDVRGAHHWLSLDSLTAGMRASLTAHDTHTVEAPTARASKPLVMEAIPSYIKRDKGSCIHCHSVRPALYEEDLAAGTWTDSKVWAFPPPSQVGIDLDRDEQTRISYVAPDSAAARAKLNKGDRIANINGQPIATASDLMFALDQFSSSGGALTVTYFRGQDDSPKLAQLALGDGWKEGTPLGFSWRPFKWGLTPAPGFGGTALNREQLAELGLLLEERGAALPLAFKISYLVTWGENSRFGKVAAKAGLQVGDILTAVLGPDKRPVELESVDHFHSWWRLTRKVGETVTIEVLRGAETKQLSLPIIE